MPGVAQPVAQRVAAEKERQAGGEAEHKHHGDLRLAQDRRTVRLLAGARVAGDFGSRCTTRLAVVTCAPVSRAPRGASAPGAASADRRPPLQASHEWIGLGAGLKKPELLGRGSRWRRPRASAGRRAKLVALEAAENLARARDDAGGKASQPRDLDAVAAIGAPGHDLPQEDDVVLPLTCGDVRVDDAGKRVGEVRELVIVRGEERLGPRLGITGQVFGDGPRDAQAVERRRAAADLVEHDQAPGRRGMQDGGGLPASPP